MSMTTYIIRRCFQGLIILALSTVIIYYLLGLLPGSPLAGLYMGLAFHKISLGDIWRLGKAWGWMDDNHHLLPWYAHYFNWLFSPDRPGIDVTILGLHIKGGGILTGDWGTSLFVSPGQGVLQQIAVYLPYTLILMGSSLVFSLVIAIPIGVTAAIKQYSKLDYTLTFFSFVGISVPSFWLGWMLIIVLGVQFKEWGLPYLPTGAAYDAGMRDDILNRVLHLILPVGVLSLQSVAGWSRFIRAQMLEVLRLDYVRTAWAKGLRQRTVILKHAFRNALIPLITLATLSIPSLFGGALIVETVFSYPGMANLYIKAVAAYDWSVVSGYLLITTMLVILGNLLADILYAAADPRIRYT